jgi:Lrp/AsnC family transcriptional regulator for asnA, asnC and gidA
MIDEKDAKILAELIQDGRKSVVEIANDLGLPRATVRERIQKMVHAGVIQRFVAIPDYSKIGKTEAAFILVACHSEADIPDQMVAEKAFRIPGVYEVAFIAGEWDILIKARGSSEEIWQVVDKLRALKGIARTETCMVFPPIKERF